MVEACREWRGDIAALALGRASATERDRVLRHCASCVACSRELHDLQRVSAAMPRADVELLDDDAAPPTGLRQRILDLVENEQHELRRRRKRRAGALLAVAAAVAIAFATLALVQGPSGDPQVAFDITAPGAQGTFVLHGDGEGTTVDFRHRGLDPAQVYWLWLTDSRCNRIGAGTFRGATSMSELTLHAALPIDDVARVWVTDRDNKVILDKSLSATSAEPLDPWSSTPPPSNGNQTEC